MLLLSTRSANGCPLKESQRLSVDTAYHSSQMSAMAGDYLARIRSLDFTLLQSASGEGEVDFILFLDE